VLILIIVACQCTLKCLEKIRIFGRENVFKAVKAYKVILHLKGKMEIVFVPFFTLAVAYAVLMLSASATVMGFRLLPPQIYWIAPLITVVGNIVLRVPLPYASACYALSESIWKEWTITKEAIGIKRFRKRLKAMRPIAFILENLES